MPLQRPYVRDLSGSPHDRFMRLGHIGPNSVGKGSSQRAPPRTTEEASSTQRREGPPHGTIRSVLRRISGARRLVQRLEERLEEWMRALQEALAPSSLSSS